MSRIAALDPTQAEGKTRELLDAVNKVLGATPNLFRVAARAPSALDGLVGLVVAASHGKLPATVRQSIAMTVAQTNGCDYCLSAHTVLGRRAGLSDQDMTAARGAEATDAKTTAILRFARTLVSERGRVGEAGLSTLRAAGVDDGEALEVVANVVLNIFTNYINLVAETDIDFPVVRAARS
ncbi:MAG TPA: carboxymuconolactone decarboxylase family protein [Polyangia bacterium]|jgi:uncharacterized peroxidase-related enzyme